MAFEEESLRVRIALGWVINLLLVTIALLFGTIDSILMDDAFRSLRVDPGRQGLVSMTHILALYALMPVYIYLVHHAEAEPELALLSINAIQKSLTDQNPLVRTMALRTMSGIRVPVISQIVSLAIKRGCGDMSPHVRKAAALAIPKCYRLDPNTLPQLVGYISTLLGDTQYFVVGSAVTAFLEVCPEELDLIHKHYRSLVKKLVDMDEWGQLATLRLLTSYARKCFPQRTETLKKTTNKGFYDDEPEEQTADSEIEEQKVLVLDPDLDLLLRACKLLLQNRNSAVIISIVRCFFYLAPPEYLASAIGPLETCAASWLMPDLAHNRVSNLTSAGSLRLLG